MNPALVILLMWGGIFVAFGLLSYYLYWKGNKLKKELQSANDLKIFKDIEIHRLAKSKMAYNFSIPSKIDVARVENKLYFLPGKFNFALFSNPVPAAVNLNLESVKISPEFSKTILVKFSSDDMESSFKKWLFLKTYFECTLTCKDSNQRDEILNHLIPKEI